MSSISIVPTSCLTARPDAQNGQRVSSDQDTGVQRQARNGRQRPFAPHWLRGRRSPRGIEGEKREGLAVCLCLTGPIRLQHRKRRKENRDRRKFGPNVWPRVRGEK